MKVNQRLIGAEFEQAAVDWISARGLRVVTRNFSARTGEIDIIAFDSECLVFLEVRRRSRSDFAGAAASVNGRKQQRIVRTAQLFLQAHQQWSDRPCRFDVIAFEPPQSGTEQQPTWLRGAFTA